MTRHKQSCGQAYVITILFLAVLLAMAAAVLDIGSWYRADRSLQATVDAAALAGAQALPDGTASASTLASQYAAKNGGGTMNITFESQVFPDDTITVSGSRPAPGFFSKMLGIKSVTVHATASARAGYPTQAKWVMPIVVDEKHPKLQCNPNPCSGPTQLVYQHFKKNGSPNGAGNFGFINLTGGHVGHKRPRRPDRQRLGPVHGPRRLRRDHGKHVQLVAHRRQPGGRGSATFCSSRSSAS